LHHQFGFQITTLIGFLPCYSLKNKYPSKTIDLKQQQEELVHQWMLTKKKLLWASKVHVVEIFQV
jgi:hypothetical protein